MTFVRVPQQSLYTEELRICNSTSYDPIFFKVLASGLAPLIYPPDPLCLCCTARPHMGYIDSEKDYLFAGVRQLVYICMALTAANP